MVKDTPIITGYYRYTDIWFEWSSVLPNPEGARSLKAILAHDSITHSDHPLHVEGVKGVQMYLGTLNATGESRLLFSSAQVDYIRYWLHAMQLTKEVIPLPYSDCLLTESDLRSVIKVAYADGGALRGAVKQIDKNNKRLKSSALGSALTSRREIFERVRAYWAEKKGVWCAIDFEAWEYDHSVITEFGWRLVGWKDGQEHRKANHVIVDEHQKYRNTKYVPEHRYDYGLGESQYVKKAAFSKMVSDFLTELSEYGPVFLVFHDNSQDIKYLKSIGAPLEGLTYISFTHPLTIPHNGPFVVDTSDLFSALEGVTDRKSLGRVCIHLQIPTKHLHNAGNDAHYTLEAMISMAEGDPVDIQRQKRWPDCTTEGVKVNFKEEEDSDRSDEEGLLAPHTSNIVNSW
ncbi:hypothetical protein E4T56_gene12485 [Termitomyces sp. T112]|nr:hypothetical protein E4T56_gene12485 [Termitomyces sp. T112]